MTQLALVDNFPEVMQGLCLSPVGISPGGHQRELDVALEEVGRLEHFMRDENAVTQQHLFFNPGIENIFLSLLKYRGKAPENVDTAPLVLPFKSNLGRFILIGSANQANEKTYESTTYLAVKKEPVKRIYRASEFVVRSVFL